MPSASAPPEVEKATVFVSPSWQQTWLGSGAEVRAQRQVDAFAKFGISAQILSVQA